MSQFIHSSINPSIHPCIHIQAQSHLSTPLAIRGGAILGAFGPSNYQDPSQPLSRPHRRPTRFDTTTIAASVASPHTASHSTAPCRHTSHRKASQESHASQVSQDSHVMCRKHRKRRKRRRHRVRRRRCTALQRRPLTLPTNPRHTAHRTAQHAMTMHRRRRRPLPGAVLNVGNPMIL